MSQDEDGPPRELFDDAVALALIGRSLLVGITEQDGHERVIRRRQVFGVVEIADRKRGILVRGDGQGLWLPPDTRGITAAGPGTYRNRTTGEVVTDPDFLASWVFTGPEWLH